MNLDKTYWENRYEINEIGWDAGNITTPLKNYIDQLANKDLKILIPGAGYGHEFDYLIAQGFKNVYVIDIAAQTINHLKAKYPEILEKFFICDDFFNLNEKFDLILEQTFFCALNPQKRENYVNKMSNILNRQGKIIGVMFNFPLTKEGPPFGGSKEEYLALFSSKFEIKTLENCYNSIKPRQDKELFVNFVKK